jgi:hypothetical protein
MESVRAFLKIWPIGCINMLSPAEGLFDARTTAWKTVEYSDTFENHFTCIKS